MNKTTLPIPKHLQSILVPMGEKNNKNRVDGVLRCTCGCETFAVSVYGGKNGKGICVGAYEEDYALVVRAACIDCGRKHLVFDMAKHGWNGFVCHDGRSVPDEELFPWACKKCGSDIHHMTLTISSQGQEDFLDELEDEIGEGKEFRAEDWVEAFGWITINLVCYDCGYDDEGWIDYETM